MPNQAHASVHIEASESQPRFHCVYGEASPKPGDGSVRLTVHPLIVYVSGARSEIVDWARRIIAAAHELPKPEEVPVMQYPSFFEERS